MRSHLRLASREGPKLWCKNPTCCGLDSQMGGRQERFQRDLNGHYNVSSER